jgi:resuscitation-promoting factor RpfA
MHFKGPNLIEPAWHLPNDSSFSYFGCNSCHWAQVVNDAPVIDDKKPQEDIPAVLNKPLSMDRRTREAPPSPAQWSASAESDDGSPAATRRDSDENPVATSAALKAPAKREAIPPGLQKKKATESIVRGHEAVVKAEPAQLPRRLGAWLIDFGAVFGTTFLLLSIAALMVGKGSFVESLSLVAVPGCLLAALLGFVYTAIFAFMFQGRTLGRLAVGIHLVDESGSAASPLRALVRAGFSLVSFALFLSGFWLALFDRYGQTLHDKVAKTFVVRFQ